MIESGLGTEDRSQEVVLRIFGRELGLPPDSPALTIDEPLVSDRLGFSSFSFVRAVIAVEDEVEVEFADEVFDTVHRSGTIGDVVRVVRDALARAGKVA
jgi:acyl carrier protein